MTNWPERRFAFPRETLTFDPVAWARWLGNTPAGTYEAYAA